MSAKMHVVVLGMEARVELERAARSNKRSLRERQRARILLAAHTGQSDAAIAQALRVHVSTVANVRRRFASGGVKASVRRAEQLNRKARCLDGDAEAHLVALVCGAPPQGRNRWSLHLLADRLVQAGYVDAISHETVRQTLKKMRSNLG
jgi:transposase